jgi:DNA-directed RNA polymerase subunit RPC12/RpoP
MIERAYETCYNCGGLFDEETMILDEKNEDIIRCEDCDYKESQRQQKKRSLKQ